MKKLLIGLCFAMFLTSCATPTDPSEAFKNESPATIFKNGKIALQSKNASDAIKHFEALDVQYPFGEETEYAQLYLIYAYYLKEEYPLAVSAADRFIRMHPASDNVAYAYFMRGVADYNQNLGIFEKIFAINLATRDLTQMQKSFADFKSVVTLFPNSPYAGPAHQYLIYLRNMLANHELNIAQFYYSRKAYIAAANRASNVVTQYQGSPAVIPGLVLMVKSYHALHLTKSEQDALLLLKFNYPEINVETYTLPKFN